MQGLSPKHRDRTDEHHRGLHVTRKRDLDRLDHQCFECLRRLHDIRIVKIRPHRYRDPTGHGSGGRVAHDSQMFHAFRRSLIRASLSRDLAHQLEQLLVELARGLHVPGSGRDSELFVV